MGQTIFDVNDLSRSFGSKRVLDRVSLRATAGQVYGLVGANGAGKTTLIRHLLGLLRAHAGSVRVFGLDPVRDPVGVLSRVGYLSEERELPEWMRVDELMAYTRFHPTWDAPMPARLLESFALDPAKKVRELSKGNARPAADIAAVAPSPGTVDFDEPSSASTWVVRRDVLDAIVRTVADDGRTVLFSSPCSRKWSGFRPRHDLGRGPRGRERCARRRATRLPAEPACGSSSSSIDRPDRGRAHHGSGGRTWSVSMADSREPFHQSVLALGGEVVNRATHARGNLSGARRTQPPAVGGA